MSSPQNSFVVRAFIKLVFSRRTLFSENCATITSSLTVGFTRWFLLSIESITFPSRERIETETFVESGTTSGLAFRLCGAIGAMIKTFDSGAQIGPPTLNEYAVDPELVATRSPSAQYVGNGCPSMVTSIPRRAAPERCTDTSFNV